MGSILIFSRKRLVEIALLIGLIIHGQTLLGSWFFGAADAAAKKPTRKRTAAAGDAATPELVRAVQVRLSTRSRAPDRDTPLASGGRPYRFAVKPAPLPTRFARMRTLFATVNLASQSGFQ